MPRPSLKQERIPELLDAFAACVARFGLDGATQDRIAAEAGIARPMLRHYLGNRDQMERLLLDHVMAQFDMMTDWLYTALPTQGRQDALLDRLFSHSAHSAQNAAVFQMLVAGADRIDGAKSALMQFVTDFEARLAAEFQGLYPGSEAEDAAVVANGVTAIYFNSDAVVPLTQPDAWHRRQRLAAERLISTLD